MNEFEKKMNALRLQFKAEQRQISKDSERTIGHLNTAIGQTPFPEAREALRAEKRRQHEAMLRSHEINRTCYLQQLELLADEERLARRESPSNRQVRRVMAQLCQYAEANDLKSLSFYFGDHRHCNIQFD